MSFIKFRSALVFFGLAISAALVPPTASAKGSIHLDIPGISIGYHTNHYRNGYRQKRHYNNHHRYNPRYNYYNKRYYNRNYRNQDYGYSGRNYRNNDRSYYGRGYNDHRYSNRSRNRNYQRNDYCPDPGYSEYAYRDQSCYSHGDHYHCS